MSSIDTMIANARAYANEAIAGAITYVERFAELEDMIDKLSFIEKLPTFDYKEISDKVFNTLNIVKSQEPDKPEIGDAPTWDYREISRQVFEVLDAVFSQQPNRPNSLGDFADIGSPPDFSGIDPERLREVIRKLVTLIESMPDRMAEAVVLFDAVNTKMLQDLIEGGYGIETTDETALWERSKERLMETTEEEINELRYHHSAFNMPVPSGAYNRALEKIIHKSNIALSDFNRDMTIKRADLYRDNRKFAIEKSIELATTQMGFIKIQASALREAVSAEFDVIRAELEEHKAELSVYGYRFDKIINEQKILSDIYRTDIAGWSARLGALTGAYGVLQQSNKDQFDADRLVTNVYADYYRTEIDAWSNRVGALIRAYGVLQQANTDQFNADRATETQEIQRARTQVEAFRAESEIRTRAMADIANVFAHKVSGALSALDTIVGKIEQITTP